MRARGFTIIELVTVLVIVAALAVFVVPRLNPEGFDRYGFRQEVLSAARYAQKTAMASSCAVRFNADAAADRVELHYQAGGNDRDCGTGGFTDPVQNPGGSGPFVLNAPSGVDITSGGMVEFDGFGAPSNGLTVAFGTGPNLEIEPVTGYAREE